MLVTAAPAVNAAPRRLAWRHRAHRRRADLPEGCSEGFDFPLLRWIWGYPATERPRVLRLLARLPAGTQVHHLRGDAEVQHFLETLS